MGVAQVPRADLVWKGSDRSMHVISKGLELQMFASWDEKGKKSHFLDTAVKLEAEDVTELFVMEGVLKVHLASILLPWAGTPSTYHSVLVHSDTLQLFPQQKDCLIEVVI